MFENGKFNKNWVDKIKKDEEVQKLLKSDDLSNTMNYDTQSPLKEDLTLRKIKIKMDTETEGDEVIVLSK